MLKNPKNNRGTGRKWEGKIKEVKNYKLPNEAKNEVIWLSTY